MRSLPFLTNQSMLPSSLLLNNTKSNPTLYACCFSHFKFGFGFDKAASEDKREQRKAKHPLDLPNLGSTFKNPEGTFAARLISDADLKGYRVGDAQVSEKHPNFVTNLGNATFNDIISIIEHVKKVVFEKFGINLETEIIILKN